MNDPSAAPGEPTDRLDRADRGDRGVGSEGSGGCGCGDTGETGETGETGATVATGVGPSPRAATIEVPAPGALVIARDPPDRSVNARMVARPDS